MNKIEAYESLDGGTFIVGTLCVSHIISALLLLVAVIKVNLI